MRIIVLVYLIISEFGLFAQPGFNRVFDLNSKGCSLINGISDSDAIYMIGVTMHDSILGLQGIALIKADTNGNVQSISSYFDSEQKSLGFTGQADLIRQNDGLLFTCGAYFSEFSLFLAAYDFDGFVHSFFKIPIINVTDIVVTDLSVYKSGFLIQGALVTLQNRFKSFLLYIDLDGNVIWEKRYGLPNLDENAFCMKVIDDNTIVIGSVVGNFFTEPWTHTRLFAVDSLGEIKWDWQSPANNEGLVSDIHRMPNGDWLYLNKKFQIFSAENVLGHSQLVRRDSNMNLLWSKQISPTEWAWSFPNKLLPTPDGNWIVSEHVALLGPDFTYMYADGMSGCLTKISSEGEIFWQTCDSVHWQLSTTFSEEYATGHVVLPSGSAILIGRTDHWQPAPTRTYGWMFKTDANGCIYDPCSVGVEEQLPELTEQKKLQIYPNPANRQIKVGIPNAFQGTWLELYDINGIIIYKNQIMPGVSYQQLDVSEFPSGIYFAMLKTLDGNMILGKLVVQH